MSPSGIGTESTSGGSRMSRTESRQLLLRLALVLLVAGLAVVVTGCQKESAQGTSEPPASQPAEEPVAESPEEPQYSSWVVYINDDDSYEKGGITYSIALNLTATNPTSEVAGEYVGKATAKTDSTGEYMGQQLNASAIANSSKLAFVLEDPSAGGALASVTEDELPKYSGSGSIVMKASGNGTYGQAGGGFSNTSGQNLKVSARGESVTLKVNIDGHTYTFDGTISGKKR